MWPSPDRKIIQVTAQGSTGEFLALCNDGTVWLRNFGGMDSVAWVRQPPVPADDTDLIEAAREREFLGL